MRRFGAAIGFAALCVAPGQAQQRWQEGQIVLGSPTAIMTGFRRCRIHGGPNGNGYYDMTCLQSYLDAYGKKVRYENRTWVSGDWIKPDDPAIDPDMQFAEVQAQQTRRDADYAARQRGDRSATTRDVPGGAPRIGTYQCYGGPAGNMKLIFRSASQYANAQGSTGTYGSKGPIVTFASGPWAGFYGYVYADGTVQLRTAPDRPSSMSCQMR